MGVKSTLYTLLPGKNSILEMSNEAQPYSASHKDNGRVGRLRLTILSWAAALAIGLEKLVIRSCNNGNAQLPSVSGIIAMVL